MAKVIYAITGGFAVCFLASLAFGADAIPPQDFRGVRWGSYPPEDKALKYIGLGMATNPAPTLAPFAGMAVKAETYFFNQRSHRLAAGSLTFDGNKFQELGEHLRSQYGEPDFVLNDGRAINRWLFRDHALWGHPRFLRIELIGLGKATIIDYNTEK